MRYAIALAVGLVVVGAVQIATGVSLGWLGIPLVWSGAAWAAVGAGYAGFGPRVFGKRPDGSMSPLHVAVLLPYLLVTWSVWRIGRRRGPVCGHEIAKGLWLGRMPLRGELSDEITAVVDLTSEFPKSRDVDDRAYICHPMLDATAPDPASLARLVEWIESRTGSVYVHCAAGVGRSATVVAAVLLARNDVLDVPSVVAFVRAARPGVRINSAQRRSLLAFSRTLAPQ